jgi:hypothetical protein
VDGTVIRPPFVPFTITPEFTRPVSAIKHFVFHTTEGGGTVESLADFFQRTLHQRQHGPGTYREGVMYISEPNGRVGSLGDWRKGVFHVANHNTECVGLEQIGHSSLTTEQWFGRLHQLWSAAWIAAYVSEQLDIPLVRSAKDRRFIAPSGFCQHGDVPDNDHTDCGSGYPFGWVMDRAREWRANGVPAFVADEVRRAA